MEQFGHNRAYTFEMDRACFSTECFRQGVYAYKCVGIVIHLGRFRAEDQVCSQAFAEFAVTLKVSRVGFQVLGRTELCRIDEIGYHYDIILLSAFFDQACVSLMEKSHGWHKAYSFSFFFPRFDLFSCFFYCFCYLHCYLLFLGQWTGIIDFEIASFLNSLSSYDSL